MLICEWPVLKKSLGSTRHWRLIPSPAGPPALVLKDNLWITASKYLDRAIRESAVFGLCSLILTQPLAVIERGKMWKLCMCSILTTLSLYLSEKHLHAFLRGVMFESLLGFDSKLEFH